MKRRIILLVGVLLLWAAKSGLGRPPGGTMTYWAYVHVYDPDGNPVEGVQVRLVVEAWLFVPPDVQEYFAGSDVGQTDANGVVFLEVDVPEDYELLSMAASVADPRYTSLSATGNYTTTAYYLYPEFVVIYDQDHDLISDYVEREIAEKFMPVLHKHSYDLQADLANFEKYVVVGRFTLNVWLDNGELDFQQVVSGSPTALHRWDEPYCWHWDTYGWGNESHGVYNLDLDDAFRYGGAPVGQRPLYYHAYKHDAYYYTYSTGTTSG